MEIIKPYVDPKSSEYMVSCPWCEDVFVDKNYKALMGDCFIHMLKCKRLMKDLSDIVFDDSEVKEFQKKGNDLIFFPNVDRKILAIKTLRGISGCGLKEAKDVVEHSISIKQGIKIVNKKNESTLLRVRDKLIEYAYMNGFHAGEFRVVTHSLHFSVNDPGFYISEKQTITHGVDFDELEIEDEPIPDPIFDGVNIMEELKAI